MTRQEEIINTIKVLRKEVEVLTTRLRSAGTGHLHTAIGVINGRIDELIGSAIDENPDQGRDLAGKIFEEDVYGNLEGQSWKRLRVIQDKAAGRKPNEVRDAYLHSSTVKDEIEHTDEYYDTERNQPITDPFAEGLSNRSMKQRYGQAVQTTSEMMQEELEPLPINIFK